MQNEVRNAYIFDWIGFVHGITVLPQAIPYKVSLERMKAPLTLSTTVLV